LFLTFPCLSPLNTRATSSHSHNAPSDWVQRWQHLLAPQSAVLDLACGHGRHMKYLAACGHKVVGIDRSPEALQAASSYGHCVLADLEGGDWPLRQENGTPQIFDAVVVTNYLWRPLFAPLLCSLAANGVLIYETFSHGNASVGKPARAAFLLAPGELLKRCQALRIVAFEEVFLPQPARFVQRVVAINEGAKTQAASAPRRYPLVPSSLESTLWVYHSGTT
jgi:SAM-dependent methyltransferase